MTDARPTRWHEATATLSDLLAWLEETKLWAEALAAADHEVMPCIEGRYATAQTAADEPTADAVSLAPAAAAPSTAAGPLDMSTLLAELTAVRHEVKLQSRSARQDREQAAGSLAQLSAAVSEFEHYRQQEATRREAVLEDAARPTAELLTDLHDAWSRAARQAREIVQSAVRTLRSWPVVPPQEPRGGWRMFAWLPWLSPAPDSATAARPGGVAHQHTALNDVLQQMRDEGAQVADRLEGLLEGYTLGLARLERALSTVGIEPIDCVGQPVDPEWMEVVQLACDDSQPSGVVVEDVRRGYRRHGRVYRYAQVVANRAAQESAKEIQ